MFGNTSTSAFNKPTGFGASGGLFGANTSNSSGLFGNNASTNANTNTNTSQSGLFGNNSNTNTNQSGLFGNNNTNTNTNSTGLFGNNNANTNTNTNSFGSTQTGTFGAQNTSGGLFGSKPAAAPSTGGLFGSNNNQTQSGGLFGSNNNQTAQSGGLFGNKPQTTQTSGLFGNNNQTAQSGGLFGGNSAQNTQSGGLFGNNSTQNTQNSGLFGSSTQNQSGGLFGGNNAQNTQSGSLFGGQNSGGLFNNQAANNNPIQNMQLNSMTRVGDLPDNIKKQLQEFDKYINQQHSVAENLQNDVRQHDRLVKSLPKDINYLYVKLKSTKQALKFDENSLLDLKVLNNELSDDINKMLQLILQLSTPGTKLSSSFQLNEFFVKKIKQYYAIFNNYETLIKEVNEILANLEVRFTQGFGNFVTIFETLKAQFELFMELCDALAPLHNQVVKAAQ